jgi:integrase
MHQKNCNMTYNFKGFSATRPVVRLIGNNLYQAFFVVYDKEKRKHQRRYSTGINEMPVRQRAKQAQALADSLWDALRSGWNPLTTKYPKFDDAPVELLSLTFEAALDRGLELKRPFISKSTTYDYEGTVRFMKAAAKECGLIDADITQILRKDIRLIVATAKETRQWSAKARNKYLEHLKSILTALVDQEIISFNPAHGIKTEPEEATLGYKRLTDAEQQKVAEHILEKDPAFFEFILFIYQCGIRRKELLLLQVKDVNILRRQLTIRPEVAKTNAERIVPLADDVFQVLLARDVNSLPPDWYIFSSNNFQPGPGPYHPNTPTTRWRHLVQEDLKIDCKMYSLKHKGADDKIHANISLDVLKTLYGHRSKQMTEIYAQAVRERYAQTIIDNSPSFAKVVKMPDRKQA